MRQWTLPWTQICLVGNGRSEPRHWLESKRVVAAYLGAISCHILPISRQLTIHFFQVPASFASLSFSWFLWFSPLERPSKPLGHCRTTSAVFRAARCFNFKAPIALTPASRLVDQTSTGKQDRAARRQSIIVHHSYKRILRTGLACT